MNHKILNAATTIISQGGVIAYPTEAVFGLGCDPFNERAVNRLLQIKQRQVDKGLILLAADWAQFENLIHLPNKKILEKVYATWPGPVTWCFPATSAVPPWICGNHSTVAIRLTAHPLAHELCRLLNHVLVSTSANIANQPACCTATEVEKTFGALIDFVIPGEVGELVRPTPILDVMTGEVVRD